MLSLTYTEMEKRIKKRVGIKDIAAKAKVSIGTVDRVLHNRGEVKAATRKKVMEIVEELGYSPNIMAKSLASKKTITIAVVIPDSSDNNPYWSKPVVGIQRATEELANYNAQVVYERFDASDIDSFADTLETVYNLNPDGVVLNPVFQDITLGYIRKFDLKNIPYVFIDVNMKGVKNLAYFGQDAEQSGIVAARIMELNTPKNPNLLIVKQANKKVFSMHIELRVKGFLSYFDNGNHTKPNLNVIEIDLLQPGEPDKSLKETFNQQPSIDGLFIPNSRGFKVADFLEKNKIKEVKALGYDLVDQNVEHLKKGNLTYLISQRPESQAFKAITHLFHNILSNKPSQKTNYVPIDILMKENIDYYQRNE